jgi:hypothetical protein
MGQGKCFAALSLQACRRTFNGLTKTPLVHLQKKDKFLVRKLLRRGNFTSKEHLQQRIESFIACFNATMAKPFRWTMNGKPLVA